MSEHSNFQIHVDTALCRSLYYDCYYEIFSLMDRQSRVDDVICVTTRAWTIRNQEARTSMFYGAGAQEMIR